jgi:hypothetical protein
MTNPYRAMCAELLRSLENYPVQPSRDRDLCVRARALLAQPEPEGLSDEEIESEFRAWWNERYGSAYFGAVPLVSVIEWTQHVTARRPTPQPPADGELTVNLRMDLSSECLKRLCDGLAAAVKPNGGYRALTTDDDISGEFIGEQQVGVEWWLPEHGCDSLENTLDSIKGRLFAAVRDWLPTAVISTSQPPADGEVAELVESVRKDRQWLDLRRDVKDRILRIADLLQRQHLQPEGGDIHYAWELHDAEGNWQAGGSAITLESVRREGNHYLQTYSQDGPHTLIIQRVSTIEEATNV